MEETSTTSLDNTQNWMKDAVKQGLIFGGIQMAVFIMLYVFEPGKLTGLSFIFFLFVFTFGYLIYHGIQWRRENGGFVPYGTAFKYIFAILIVSSILSQIVNVVLLLVDPTLPEVMADGQLNTSLYWAETMGAPPETVDKINEDFDLEEVKKTFDLSGLLPKFGFSILSSAIVAAIIALFVKKNPPEII